MGDRGNIGIKSGDSTVFLYSHWSGSELPSMLQSALSRKQRWDDDQYLTRIIFDEMTRGRQGEETGFGIGTYIGDNGHPILYVDTITEMVKVGDLSFTFDEYIDLTPEKLGELS